jgi:hypothetical protein
MEKTFKIRFGYCHIFDDKIVLTKKSEIKDLIADYEKSISDFFKTLMVFLIFIPLFTALSVILYYEGKLGISLNAGAFALFFLVFSFYTILFTSGSPVIKRNTIIKIKFKKRLWLFNTIQIKYKSFGRIKTRSFVVENDQVNTALNLLKEEELIQENDIDYNYGKVKIYSLIATVVLIFILIQFLPNVLFDFLPETERSSAEFGMFYLVLSFALISYMIQYPISYIFKKKQKFKS